MLVMNSFRLHLSFLRFTIRGVGPRPLKADRATSEHELTCGGWQHLQELRPLLLRPCSERLRLTSCQPVDILCDGNVVAFRDDCSILCN